MKIGIIGTIWVNTPPEGYGGTEQVVYNLCNGLVEKGHDVTLFSSSRAQTKANLSPTVNVPLRDKDIPWTDVSYHIYHLSQAFDRAKEFDILHMHLNKNQDYFSLPLAASCPTPVLTTTHFQLPTPKAHFDRYQLLMKYKDLPFTSISFSQRAQMPLNFIETVYNALPLEDYPYSDTPDDYYLWIGKITSFKNPKGAILAAKKAGVKLKIAGVIEEGVPEYLSYWEKEVKPLIDGKQIEWMGPVGLPEKAALYGKAKAFLNPIAWEEPFGLVMIEAQATGTPVISFKRGAAPEVIQDGKTGFLVETVDEMAEKIKEVEKLSRKDCRINVESNFTVERMAEHYEQGYKATIEHWSTYKLTSQRTRETLKDIPAEV